MGWLSIPRSYSLFQKVLYGLLILFLIYIALELLRKILGGSLGFEELVIGLLIANLGYSFYLKEAINKVDTKVSGHLGWHRSKDDERK